MVLIMKVFLVHDYRKAFYSRVSNNRGLCSLSLFALVDAFKALNYEVESLGFSEIANKDIKNSVVLYTSSEDQYSVYKNYIESIILDVSGSVKLIPSFEFLKAHHNKVGMELLRNRLLPEQKTIFDTGFFGCVEELDEHKFIGGWPKVFKVSFGAGSNSVALAYDKFQLLKIAKRLTRTFFWPEFIYELIARIRRKNYIYRSLHRNSFIVQNFIPDLDGDYKVLVYGKKYYILKRFNRPNDFRASGSGLFEFDISNKAELNLVLDYARECFFKLKTPLLSLDIAISNGKPYLIEFQAVSFGTLTAEKSKHSYEYVENKWHRISESCDLELVFVRAIDDFLNQELGI